jgi:hypothetical protein
MPTFRAVPLRFAPDQPRAWVRELCGHDEDDVDATDTPTAIRLIDRVLTCPDGTTRPPARSLTASDRDRLLAALFCLTYGSRVASTIRCRQCTERFDLDFDLRDLQSNLDERDGTHGDAPADDDFTAADGARFRLPTGEDELAVAALAPEAARRALLARCAGGNAVVVEEIEAAMRRIAPLLAGDVSATCPECGAEQSVHFDIQTYLLGSLLAEGRRLVRDVHRLARAYGWTRSDILAMPRRARRAYVALVEDELSTRQSIVV